MKKKTNPYLQDYFAKKAKKDNFAARSAYKLEEIQNKYKILKPGYNVLDLGAAPGSWSQYAHIKTAPQGHVVGIDLKPIEVKLERGKFIQADLLERPLNELLSENGLFAGPFDVVLSDMAPNTTGIKFTDQMRSLELCELALKLATQNLKPGGHFVCKLFHSNEFGAFKAQITSAFKQFHAVKPQSTRSISKEIFLVGLARK